MKNKLLFFLVIFIIGIIFFFIFYENEQPILSLENEYVHYQNIYQSPQNTVRLV